MGIRRHHGRLVRPAQRVLPEQVSARFSKDDAWRGVGGGPLTSRAFEDEGSRNFYVYCRQQGVWPVSVSGFDPKTQGEDSAYCPAQKRDQGLSADALDPWDRRHRRAARAIGRNGSRVDSGRGRASADLGAARRPRSRRRAIPGRSPTPTMPRWPLSSGTSKRVEIARCHLSPTVVVVRHAGREARPCFVVEPPEVRLGAPGFLVSPHEVAEHAPFAIYLVTGILVLPVLPGRRPGRGGPGG